MAISKISILYCDFMFSIELDRRDIYETCSRETERPGNNTKQSRVHRSRGRIIYFLWKKVPYFYRGGRSKEYDPRAATRPLGLQLVASPMIIIVMPRGVHRCAHTCGLLCSLARIYLRGARTEL
jgi:hypothetical protein